MKRIERSAIVAHGAGQVYALVEDIESYPRFLPWCVAARVQRSPGGVTAALDVGVKGLSHSFTTRNENIPGAAIDMRLVDGPFRHFAAAWRFRPLAPDACEIAFSMEYSFASRAAGRLLEPLFARIADTMVDAFSRRADELYPR